MNRDVLRSLREKYSETVCLAAPETPQRSGAKHDHSGRTWLTLTSKRARDRFPSYIFSKKTLISILRVFKRARGFLTL